MPHALTKTSIEEACKRFLSFGVGADGGGHVIIRSGHMGAFVANRKRSAWVDAFWTEQNAGKVVDVTGALQQILTKSLTSGLNRTSGAGNGFLGGLAAGLLMTHNDVFECECVPLF